MFKFHSFTVFFIRLATDIFLGAKWVHAVLNVLHRFTVCFPVIIIIKVPRVITAAASSSEKDCKISLDLIFGSLFLMMKYPSSLLGFFFFLRLLLSPCWIYKYLKIYGKVKGLGEEFRNCLVSAL
jgi:hypothetical protein